jgi:hypothetical protein
MLPFPMPLTCKIYKRKAPTFNRSGQATAGTEFETVAIDVPNCIYYSYTGTKILNPSVEFNQTAAIYFPAGTNIDEGDKITDIAGTEVFAPGPFEAMSVRKLTNFKGKVHHISVKARAIN